MFRIPVSSYFELFRAAFPSPRFFFSDTKSFSCIPETHRSLQVCILRFRLSMCRQINYGFIHRIREQRFPGIPSPLFSCRDLHSCYRTASEKFVCPDSCAQKHNGDHVIPLASRLRGILRLTPVLPVSCALGWPGQISVQRPPCVWEAGTCCRGSSGRSGCGGCFSGARTQLVLRHGKWFRPSAVFRRKQRLCRPSVPDEALLAFPRLMAAAKCL